MRSIQPALTVRIARFAAPPRDRQVVIALHERALFDHLTLELGPAFPGDSLIAVGIRRTFEGKAVVTPRAFGFEDDRASAAWFAGDRRPQRSEAVG